MEKFTPINYIKVVIGSWGSYNACNERALGSKWIDLYDFESWEEIEEEYNCMVYAITHDYTEFGECYSFLLVTDYEEEWDYLFEKSGNEFYVFAYVWNKDDEWCSEFGTIGIKSFSGGIKRIS